MKKSKMLLKGRHLLFFGGEGSWEYVSRAKSRTGAAIVAVTNEDRLLLVEQFRPPVGKSVIELPAGLVGDTEADEHESLKTTAKRELKEETGFDCRVMTILCRVAVLPGSTDELNVICMARQLSAIGDGAVEKFKDGSIRHSKKRGKKAEGECLTVYEVPLATIDHWLRRQERMGKLIDLKVYAGLSFLKK
ncbi:MAG: NUDIX hydrolase [Candidatus Sumerlaeota bacterium]|nr:NUDIX hydrolase [Candidatus Sumerlaeota bacterium]